MLHQFTEEKQTINDASSLKGIERKNNFIYKNQENFNHGEEDYDEAHDRFLW